GQGVTARQDQVSSDRVGRLAVRCAVAADPDPETDAPVRDAQVAPDGQVADAVEDEREVRGAVDDDVATDLYRPARSVGSVVSRLDRLRLRREEIAADGHALEMSPASEAEQPHVVPDRRSQDVGARLLAESDDVVPDPRVGDV